MQISGSRAAASLLPMRAAKNLAVNLASNTGETPSPTEPAFRVAEDRAQDVAADGVIEDAVDARVAEHNLDGPPWVRVTQMLRPLDLAGGQGLTDPGG